MVQGAIENGIPSVGQIPLSHAGGEAGGEEGKVRNASQGEGCSEENQPWSRAVWPRQEHPVLPSPAPSRKLFFILCGAKHGRLENPTVQGMKILSEWLLEERFKSGAKNISQ